MGLGAGLGSREELMGHWGTPGLGLGSWGLALLAMTTATAVMDEVPMDMAPNSFDDRYWGCRDKMTAGCRDYGHELQQNSLFAQAWPQQWQRRVPCALSFLGPGHRHHGLHGANVIVQGVSHAVREAGILLDTETNFQLQSSAFPWQTVRGSAWPDGPVGQFTSTSLSKTVSEGYGTDTFFRCTCGWYTALLSPGQEVLIPPFETFDVTEVIRIGDTGHISSTPRGCIATTTAQWLRGDVMGTPLAPSGEVAGQGFLLALAALAVATGIL
uniref:NAD(P)(+)--arginine ADP-ribosyltransferase n=1 Tax=Malurus cyaneus samueli TaxID=2593467 RepID=A0A8C5U7M7_9PASS